MVTERLAERTPDTTHQLVDLGRRLSALKGPNEVGPHDLERDESVSTAGTTLSIGLVNVIRLGCAGPLPDRCSSLVDQHLWYVRHHSTAPFPDRQTMDRKSRLTLHDARAPSP
jgi:hypothetical protein